MRLRMNMNVQEYEEQQQNLITNVGGKYMVKTPTF